jgi:hypothetical protein
MDRHTGTPIQKQLAEHFNKDGQEHDSSLPQPAWYFFYGTLMDPKRLAAVAGLDKEPTMSRATIRHKQLQRWGPFLVLVWGEENVDGLVWYAPSAEIVERLRDYEGSTYRDVFVSVELDGGDTITARTFMLDCGEDDLRDGPR